MATGTPPSPDASAAESWSGTGVRATSEPRWLFVRKVVWRSGPEALVLPGSDPDVRRLQQLLADTRRLDYLCGFHWSFDFAYASGPTESLLVNEKCESFETNGKEVWSLLSTLFERARNDPSHYLLRVVVRDAKTKAGVHAVLERRVGPTLDPDPSGSNLLVASETPWSPAKAELIKRFSPDVESVQQIPVLDTGS